jgi:UDPglucose 6-dehydrogenase
MRYESAELAKISINICLVASVSAANVLAEICEHIGADWAEVVPALRLDQRIGQYSYLSPGLGISGGNLERDLATVLRLSESYKIDAGTVSAWLANSHHRKNWPYSSLERMILKDNPNAAIAVLGLAYKENTHSTKNSPALVLIEQLSACKVTVYDPVVPARAAGDHVIAASSALDAANGADAIAIMTPWPEFHGLTAGNLAQHMAGRVVIDPYRVLNGKELRAKGFTYATLGAPLKGLC